MARPIKATVDYFPHVTEHGKTLFILENTWGNDGYAAWFKILERIGSSENHVLNLNDSSEYAYLAAYCKVSQETLTAILDQCSALNAINPGLWRKKLVYSENFVENVADAYRKRKEKLPSVERIKSIYIEFFPEETPLKAGETPLEEVSGDINGEREREREIKEKKKVKKKIPLPPDFGISDRVKEWAAKHKRNHLEEHLEAFKLKCSANGYEYEDWDSAFMESIRADWGRVEASGQSKAKTGGILKA